MDIQHVKTSECSIGDIIGDDIINAYGVKLIMKDTVINDYIKEKLLQLGIEDIFNDLVSGKKLDHHSIEYISDMILSTMGSYGTIIQYINDIKSTDEYTYTHCVNVAFYSMMLAKWMRLSEAEIKGVVQAGLLHDLGKVKVPGEILNKKGYLTRQEYEEIKKHSQYGYDIINSSRHIHEDIKNAVLMHHERMDGSGYPFGAKRDSLNLYSRIIAITDVFDAMTTDRVYKKKVSPFEVFELFITTGDYIFDASMIRVFINNISPQYTGARVILNNGESGEIAYVPPYDVTNPIIRVNSNSEFILGKDRILNVEGTGTKCL